MLYLLEVFNEQTYDVIIVKQLQCIEDYMESVSAFLNFIADMHDLRKLKVFYFFSLNIMLVGHQKVECNSFVQFRYAYMQQSAW